MKEASFYLKTEENKVRCELCPHHCVLMEGTRGICLTRHNEKGILVSDNYSRPVSTAVDPIEKKPLYHFFPGTTIFSTGPNGCNFKCSFCQNFEISQELQPTREIPSERLTTMVAQSGTIGIAYTYSEPYIWFETIMETGARIKERGLKNVMVTNGYMEERPVKELLTVIDAMNIDIKSMNPDFYRRLCKGTLDPVLRTCIQVKKAGCHLEITNLLITGENDSPEETERLVTWIATELGADTPLHISRYFPRYHMHGAATPVNELDRAYTIAREHLDYVYVGNVASANRSNTQCPSCSTVLVRREGYTIEIQPQLVVNGSHRCVCGSCGHSTNIRQ
jgi:pyruvate formate lyase activating enzyme